MHKLTVIIPTYNEEQNIADCLETIKWADEILVVDSFSTDRTLEIARKYGTTILQHEYINSATQKNWAIPQAQYDWVLIVDADERVTPLLQEEIQSLLQMTPPHDGYWIQRKNHIWGRPIRYCGWQYDRVLRLFNRWKGKYETKEVHADLLIQGSTGRLQHSLLHYTYRDLKHYFEKFKQYTDWGAKELQKQGKRARLDHLLLHPLFCFFRKYIIQFGFLDGIHGFVLCVLSSFYVFTKYAKLWEMTRKESSSSRRPI